MGVEKRSNIHQFFVPPSPLSPPTRGGGSICRTVSSGVFSLSAPRDIYPSIAFRSASGVVIGIMLKVFTSTSRTFGVMKAGRLGPNRMFLIPR